MSDNSCGEENKMVQSENEKLKSGDCRIYGFETGDGNEHTK